MATTISNLNTQQTPITSGLTGTQVIEFIAGPRVYVKTADSTPTPVVAKSAGVLPSGWTDLGIVDKAVKVTYTKETKEVRTGIDQVLRATYIGKKTAQFQFDLAQVDDVVIKNLTGITPSALGSSVEQFAIGGEDVVTLALLLVLQNKLDGKEIQFYHPGAFINFGYSSNTDQVVVSGTGDLPIFTYGSVQAIFINTIFP